MYTYAFRDCWRAGLHANCRPSTLQQIGVRACTPIRFGVQAHTPICDWRAVWLAFINPRKLLMQANMAPEWWGEAVTVATATTNCLTSLSKSKATPIELMFKSTPNVGIF
jgi:hypothetical protein